MSLVFLGVPITLNKWLILCNVSVIGSKSVSLTQRQYFSGEKEKKTYSDAMQVVVTIY